MIHPSRVLIRWALALDSTAHITSPRVVGWSRTRVPERRRYTWSDWCELEECQISSLLDLRLHSARGDTSEDALVDIQRAKALWLDDAPLLP